MEGILHQLIGSLSQNLHGFLHSRWLAGFLNHPLESIFLKTSRSLRFFHHSLKVRHQVVHARQGVRMIHAQPASMVLVGTVPKGKPRKLRNCIGHCMKHQNRLFPKKIQVTVASFSKTNLDDLEYIFVGLLPILRRILWEV